MYSKYPHLILGFHGTDKSVAERVLRNNERLTHTKNPYDWLGHGVYFWESNPERAMDFAKELQSRGKIKEPAVIGAVLDLGICLNLLDSKYLYVVKDAYDAYRNYCDKTGKPRLENKNTKGTTDLLLRHLDCAVLETLHVLREETNHTAFSSVRGAFLEGEPLYENAGFKEKNHIQICIRNPNCIKGLFHPLDKDEDFALP